MIVLLWILGIAAAFAAASALALYSFGRFARQARGSPSTALPKALADTPLDRAVAPLVAARGGASGLALLFDNREAFALRLASVRQAGRSLDLVTYIWRDDMTGRLLARELVAAADRGVRVRLLLDDVNVQGFDPKFRALNGHPGIEVRLFNPIRNRRFAIRRGLEMLLALVRYNRRIHAKLWIADGRLAITGGRNVGNCYFGAERPRRRNSRDADIAMVGPVTEAAETVFDAYWNSGPALPIAAFWRDYEAGLDRLRTRLEETARHPAARALLAVADRIAPVPVDRLCWTQAVRLVADPPEKALGQGRDTWLPSALGPALTGATRSVRLVTPYFVPGREGVTLLSGLAARGVQVEVLTNALAATNHTIVHGAYRRYRRGLLAAGVRLVEFAPPDADGRKGDMLHAKGFSIDGRTAFVGSFNYDLRSAFLNIELGVLFEDPALVAAFDAEVARWADPSQAFALQLEGRQLRWLRGAALPALHDPGADALRRGASWVIGHLPIHRLL